MAAITFTNSRHGKAMLLVGLLALALVALNAPVLFRQPSRQLAVAATDNSTLRISDKQPVFKVGDIADIKQGEDNTLILTKQGKVYAAGSNKYGQLGSGVFGGRSDELQPVKADGVRFKQIDMTHRHALALAENGDVWAWGMNLSGQIGNGNRKDTAGPSKVLGGVKDIAAGYRFSAAIKTDGQLWAWGMQCDPKTPGLEQLAASFAHDISVGGSYYDGRSQTDEVYCLEEENLPIASIKPRHIQTTARFATASAGYGHLLLLDEKQGAWGFGCNAWGQLGRGHFRNDGGTRRLFKVDFPENIKLQQIEAGFRHGIALDADGGVWSWGHDTQGDPVAYKANRSDKPTLIKKVPADVKQVKAGHDVSGLLAGRAVYAAGDNQTGQISRSTGKEKQAVVQDFVNIGEGRNFSLGYSRHIYW
jgi:alpha-tubulin suppressor-like RCC1 family protein